MLHSLGVLLVLCGVVGFMVYAVRRISKPRLDFPKDAILPGDAATITTLIQEYPGMDYFWVAAHPNGKIVISLVGDGPDGAFWGNRVHRVYDVCSCAHCCLLEVVAALGISTPAYGVAHYIRGETTAHIHYKDGVYSMRRPALIVEFSWRSVIRMITHNKPTTWSALCHDVR